MTTVTGGGAVTDSESDSESERRRRHKSKVSDRHGDGLTGRFGAAAAGQPGPGRTDSESDYFNLKL